jgi:hypothetical protein
MIDISKDITRTIYSIAWPETHKIFSNLNTKDIQEQFTQTWTKKQDELHKPYLDLWVKAHAKNLNIEGMFNFSYPTNGSSESIFQQLSHLHSQGKRLVVFYEEYEGYIMFANNIHMPVHFISRNNPDFSSLNKNTDVFFLSQPSSIDGNMWDGFHGFMKQLDKLGISAYIDLAYLGVFPHETIDLTPYKNIDGVFFSLSKIFGVYYHRIGGCFLKNENPLLWPMLWFKNLNSIHYGTLMLEQYIEGKYTQQILDNKKYQADICMELSALLQCNVKPSDVPMIAQVEYDNNKYPWMSFYKRNDNPSHIRICISPLLEKKIYNN